MNAPDFSSPYPPNPTALPQTLFLHSIIPSTTYKPPAPNPRDPYAISKVWQHKRPSTPHPRLPLSRRPPARAHYARTKRTHSHFRTPATPPRSLPWVVPRESPSNPRSLSFTISPLLFLNPTNPPNPSQPPIPPNHSVILNLQEGPPCAHASSV